MRTEHCRIPCENVMRSSGNGKTSNHVAIRRLPWAQEARGSNPRVPTTYFFVFNLLCLT